MYSFVNTAYIACSPMSLHHNADDNDNGIAHLFLSRVSILKRDIDIANLSVCPSVCPLRSGIR